MSDWIDLPKSEFMKRWYTECYTSTSYSGAIGRFHSAMHRSLERKLSGRTFGKVLEIGANNAEHLTFVNHDFETYLLTDVSSPAEEALAKAEKRKGVSFELQDAQALTFNGETFDRVVVTCVLHHLSNPELALMEFRRVLKAGGQLDLLLPSDPGILFRFARAIGPMRKAKSRGLGEVKRLVDARDHINHSFGLLSLIRHVFRNDVIIIRTYPLPTQSQDLSLWKAVRVVRLEK